MAEINLNEELVYYFGLFLIRREEDGEAASKPINYRFLRQLYLNKIADVPIACF